MEAGGVLALTCALGAAGVSAGTFGVLACQRFESLPGKIARRIQESGGLRNLPAALRGSLERQLMRMPWASEAMKAMRTTRRRMQIRKSLPDVIRLLCISLDAGSSLGKALEYAADNSTGVIAKELKAAVWSMQAGQSFEESMEQLRYRTGGSEFECLSVAMEVQHRCGGTLGNILSELSNMLQQTSELEDELVTKTTQAQLSARVVALMPLLVLALLTVVSPGYLSQFVDSSAGIAMFLLAVVLELVGVVLVKRSLDVDVGIEEG